MSMTVLRYVLDVKEEICENTNLPLEVFSENWINNLIITFLFVHFLQLENMAILQYGNVV